MIAPHYSLQNPGDAPRSRKPLFTKWLALVAIAAIPFAGCSKSKSVAKIVDNTPTDTAGKGPDKDPGTTPGAIVSAVDSLVKKNKGKGLGVVTGFLTGEGKSISAGVLKQAANAAGERRLLSNETVPLKSATVLIFNALAPTTQADTTLKTDTAGNYTVVLPEGKYFGFAVYLDLETFSLVTTQIPNISPKADTVVKMDTAVAIEDETAPSVTSVYDALAPNSDKIFLVGSIPATGAKINITFSEPMNRESAKGVLLGKIDTSNSGTTLVLADTVKNVTMTWSGDSKELTLNVKELSEGEQYGVIVPVSCKDLAKNAVDAVYGATFVTAKASDLAKIEFAVSSNFPNDGETIKPIQNPSISFNRPVDVFTVMKNVTVTPEIVGFWEVAGARATFIHKDPFKVGATYTVKIPTTIKDLAGNAIAKEASVTFVGKDFEGAAKDKTGDAQLVALSVEQMFDAYLQGDIGRFGTYFHPNFRMVDESKILSRAQFLDARRLDVAEKQLLSAGYLAPVYDASVDACKDHLQRWKVNAEGGSGDPIWAESYTSAGQIPRFWDKDGKEITKSELQFDGNVPRLTYKGKKYGFAPDFSQYHGPVNQDNAKQDLRFMADIMAKTSTLALEAVKVEMKDEFKVDGGLTVTGDTAKVAVKMSSSEKYSRTNFDGSRGCDSTGGTHFEILKFLMVRDGSKWLVLNIEGGGGDKISQDDFNNKTVDMASFGQNQIQPFDLMEPINTKENAANAKSQVVFKWKRAPSDSVSGYIVGIAEDGRFCGNRPPYGALFFVKAGTGAEVSFTLDEFAQVVGTNANAIMRRAQDLKLPGWERVMFEYVLPKLIEESEGMAGVYNWKVIAVRDSSASEFLANGFKPQRFYGESDFGITKAKGYFSVKKMPQGAAFNTYNNQTNSVQNSGAVGFGDMDQDGYPDYIEQKYGTDMRSRDSYPDFRLDTDGDKIPDFLEKMLDPTGTLALVTTKADDGDLQDETEALAALKTPIVIEDTDGDGFPNDIEQLLGFNSNDKNNNPGTRARAEAPIGVFKGKLAMGDAKNDVTVKTFKDTTGNLWAFYTAFIGKDTLTDTVRASFSDLQNTLVFQIFLPKDGPNAGKSLWMRGNYDQFQQLLMGPMDLGPSADKKSTVVNGGPQAGQWAASGRGEDVSGRLGGANSGTNTTTGTAQQNNGEVTYRLPPAGITEGSKIEFTSDGGVVVVNEVGDTLAKIDTVTIRRQPTGFEFQAIQKIQFANGGSFTDLGGMLVQKPEGWIIDGHIFQQFDSATVHRSIPGQIAFKTGKGDVVVKGDEPIIVVGSLKGWIQQDRNGTGLNGGQTTTDPNAGTNCPAGQTCNNTGTNPTNTNTGSFGKPYMGGSRSFTDYLGKLGIQSGATFYASAGTYVMSVVNDSNHVMNAKAPWCNQLLLRGTIITPKIPTDAEKQKLSEMQKQLDDGLRLLVVLEDPASPGTLSITEKVLDASGEIRLKVVAVEARTPGADYGLTTMVCGNPNTNPNPNPNPGPAIPGFSGNEANARQALTANGGLVVWFNDLKQEQKVEVDPASVGRDSGSKFIFVVSRTQPPQRLVFLNNNGIASEMAMSGSNPVVAPPNLTNPAATCPVNTVCTQPPVDTCTAAKPCTNNPPPSTCPVNTVCTQPPVDTCTAAKPCTTNPSDTAKGIVLYNGDTQRVTNLLTQSTNQAGVMVQKGSDPIGTVVNIATVRKEGTMVLVNDAADDLTVYVVLGVAADPTKPMIFNGVLVVAPKALLAQL